jgi:antitoxin MazE
MDTHVQKWGNSLGLRIPSHFATRLHLSPGKKVTLEVDDSRLIIQASQYNLKEMLEQITPANKHHLQMDDPSRGGEEW